MPLPIPPGNAELLVNFRPFGGWKEIDILKTIESVSNSFSFSVSDRWTANSLVGQAVSAISGGWEIREGDEATVLIDKKPIITGRVDDREVEYDSSQHSVTLRGRDKAANLVDSSVSLGAWEFKKNPPMVFLNRLGAQFGVIFRPGVGVIPPAFPENKISINPGDTGFDVVDRITRYYGLICHSDGVGNVVLDQPGKNPAPAGLIEGMNILGARSTFSQKDRFFRYVVLGQSYSDDLIKGPFATEIRGEYFDNGVKDKKRILLIEADGKINLKKATDRAKWEMTIRRARAARVTFKVRGWNAQPGKLWTPGESVVVKAPVAGVSGPMLITSVRYVLNEEGTYSHITVGRLDSFTPLQAPEGSWKL